MNDVKLCRERLNIAALIIPGQWLTLMCVYWIRFYSPLRPFGFEAKLPPISLLLLGCVCSVIPFFLPKSYFVPRGFERGSFYPRLGLRWFRYFAPDGDLINKLLRKIQPGYRVIADRRSWKKHLEGTYSNERWHTSFFLAGLFTSIHAIFTGQLVMGTLLVLANTIFNLFPLMHQRYKRTRSRRFNLNYAGHDTA